MNQRPLFASAARLPRKRLDGPFLRRDLTRSQRPPLAYLGEDKIFCSALWPIYYIYGVFQSRNSEFPVVGVPT
jgi:hypothetical protein